MDTTKLTHLTLAVDRPTWKRQEGETDREWGSFILFRDMHPSIRTLRKAFIAFLAINVGQAKAAEVAKKTTNASPWFSETAARNRWHDRVAAYDEWMDQERLRMLQARRVSALVETADLGMAMRQKAMAALDALQTILYETTIDENGDLIQVAKSALSPSAIAQLAKVGIDLERYALGMEQAAGAGVNINIGMSGGSGSLSLPNPESDEVILARVVEIAHARHLLPKPSAKPSAKPSDKPSAKFSAKPSTQPDTIQGSAKPSSNQGGKPTQQLAPGRDG